MKKNQKSNWESTIMNMSQENRMELAEIIIKQISTNRCLLKQHGDYNEVLEILKTTLREYNKQLTEKKDTTKIKKNLEILSNLDVEYQKKLFIYFSEEICKINEMAKRDKELANCKQTSHKFSDWEECKWTTKEVYWDAGPQGYFDVPHTEWTRKCIKCEYVETSEIEPEEVKNSRLQKEKKAKVKALKLELENLKKKN